MKIPENKTLQELFEWRFDKTPDSIAHKFSLHNTAVVQIKSRILLSSCSNNMGCQNLMKFNFYLLLPASPEFQISM